ncbi:MAG: hypothetical protein QE278_14415 [Limnobacter sp.]|nr:hypothetical protein [Limnobacter sp.]
MGFALFGWSAVSWAGDAHIVCRAETSSQEISLALQPGSDIFALQHMNFDNGHRVSLQLLQAPERLKTYVYDDSKNRLVLLNSQVYLLGKAPECGRREVDARTYSGGFERELILQCEWSCGNGVQK